jgi:hypothetical protein
MSGLPFGLAPLLDLTGYQYQNTGPLVVPTTNVGARVTRSIDPAGYGFSPEVTIEEDADDVLEITQHPVEQGAAITDHAYKRPAELRMQIGWSDRYDNSSGNLLYSWILDLQSSRRPFSIVTGKRSYQNMLVSDIRQHTDAKFEYSLMIDISFREILLVNTQTNPGTGNGNGSAVQLANPPANAPTATAGPQQPTSVSLTDQQLSNAGMEQSGGTGDF